MHINWDGERLPTESPVQIKPNIKCFSFLTWVGLRTSKLIAAFENTEVFPMPHTEYDKPKIDESNLFLSSND